MNRALAKKRFDQKNITVHNFLLRRNTNRNQMSKPTLDKMIAENIRGLDQDTANKEILRLNVINKNLGYRLPEKQRIEKLIYAKGRNDLVDPTNLSIVGAINRLTNTVKDPSRKLPFNVRRYQFMVDLAQQQVNTNYSNEEVIIIDTLKDIYSVFDIDDLIEINDILDTLINKVINKDRFIVMYLNPHDTTTKADLIKLNQISTRVDNDKIDLLEFKKQPIEKSDITKLRNDIIDSVEQLIKMEKIEMSDVSDFELTEDEEIEAKNKIINIIDGNADEQIDKLESDKEKSSMENIIEQVQDDVIKNKETDVEALIIEETQDLDKNQKENVLIAVQNVKDKSEPEIKKIVDEAKEEKKESKNTIEAIANEFIKNPNKLKFTDLGGGLEKKQFVKRNFPIALSPGDIKPADIIDDISDSELKSLKRNNVVRNVRKDKEIAEGAKLNTRFAFVRNVILMIYVVRNNIK